MIWFIIGVIILILGAKYCAEPIFWFGFILTSALVAIIKFNPALFSDMYLANSLFSIQWYWILALPFIGGFALAFMCGFMIGWFAVR